MSEDQRGTSYEGIAPIQVEQRRVALVIGNGRYTHASPLENPANDARAMSTVLRNLGFDVETGLDLDLRAMGDVQERFEARLRGKPDVALLFYAGHGLQVKGRNYLVPIDAQIEAQAHLSSRAILFNDLLEPMSEDAGASLIFLDACRDNPFTRNLARTFGEGARSAGIRGGLARIEKVAGTFISYATAPDTVAYDGKGDNSPYTGALLRHIESPGLSVADMMIDVRNAVLTETSNKQEPWDQSSLRSRFYFVPEEAAPPPEAPSLSAAAEEWAAIQNTSSLATLALFKERYPDPPWSEYADIRAGELRLADRERHEAAEAAKERAKVVQPAHPKVKTPPAVKPTRRDRPGSRSKPMVGMGKPRWGNIGILVGATAMVAGLVIWQPWSTGRGPIEQPAVGSVASVKKPFQPTQPASCAGIKVAVAGSGTQCLDPNDKNNREFQDCFKVKGRNVCAPRMVVVPAGNFTMGSPKDEPERDRDEVQVPIQIRAPFAIGTYEVTFEQWDACVADGGCKHKPKANWGRGKQPIMRVSWDDITKQYLPWLNGKLGLKGDAGYRLPSEAEWEYAARAGSKTPFWWGSSITQAQANYDGNFVYRGGGDKGAYREKTVPVDSFKANPWGLYNVHGNVWEWTADCWNASNSGNPGNGNARTTGDCIQRVVRGGSWYSNPQLLRSANRNGRITTDRSNGRGFRLARTLNP